MISRRARLAALEKAYAPHVLAGYRFVTHIEVAPDDPWCGKHADLRLAGSPIGELLIYSDTRSGYHGQREALRSRYTLLEG